MQALSKKGVLFLTAGFHQPYVFQSIANIVEYGCDPSSLAILKIVLSDGETYISGLYYAKTLAEVQKCESIKEFDILRVYATYGGASRPIMITSLQILSQNHRGIYGRMPISLVDYLESRVVKQETAPLFPFQNFQSFEKIPNGKNENVSNHGLQKNRFPPNQNPIQQVQDNQNVQRDQKDVEIDRPVLLQEKEVEIDRIDSNQEHSDKDIENEDKKRNERIDIPQQVNQNPQKKLKPNQEDQEEGEIIFLEKKNASQVEKRTNQAEPNQNKLRFSNQFSNDLPKNEEPTQKNPQPSVVQINVFDVEQMVTQKQSVQFYPQCVRKEMRKSQIAMLESILESDEKSAKQTSTDINQSDSNQESITIPKSHAFSELKKTPIKSEAKIFPLSPQPRQIGTTTEKKKLREQYNLLISNLYESNESFKIICRVNYLYEWRSKNDVPCLALDLMDSEGDQIKAIIYMNHSTKDCKQCGSMIEVGKVYCFQNGECKRDYFQKEELELVFNLKAKPAWGKEIICGGRNKIIPTKIRIQPLLQHRILSISKLIEQFDSGKNSLSNVYGVLESFKVSQYESKIKDPPVPRQEDSPDVEIIQVQSTGLEKSIKKNQTMAKTLYEGYTKLYLSGFLTDPLEKNKIFFTLVITKPKSEQTQSAKDFLEKNMIRQGSLVVLHNVKIQANNTNTVRKLEKTKKTYIQLITNENISWKYNKQDFGAQIVVLAEDLDGFGLNAVFNEILSLSPIQLQLVYQNPRFLNFSQQPYTERTILQMNELLEKSILPDQSCYSELKDVKIHSIDQKPSVEICFYCKKRVKSSENTSEKTASNVNDLIKHCTKCKKIVKVITMHVFNVVFADNTASFLVEILKDEYIETILGVNIEKFLGLTQDERTSHLQVIKYTDFQIRVRSENKIGGVIHKITSIEKFPVKSKIDEIRTEKKGVQKHYKQLESNW